MAVKTPIILAMALVVAVPISLGAKKKNQPDRGMLRRQAEGIGWLGFLLGIRRHY